MILGMTRRRSNGGIGGLVGAWPIVPVRVRVRVRRRGRPPRRYRRRREEGDLVGEGAARSELTMSIDATLDATSAGPRAVATLLAALAGVAGANAASPLANSDSFARHNSATGLSGGQL